MANRNVIREFNCKDRESIQTSRIDWDIEGFSHRNQRPGSNLLSSHFWFEEDKSTSWYLGLYPNGSTAEQEGYLSLFLYAENFEQRRQISCSFYLLDDAGKIYKSNHFDKTFEDDLSCGYVNWLTKDELLTKGLLKNDTLHIRCEIDLITFSTASKDSNEKIAPNKEEEKEAIHIFPSNWLFSGIVILKCENKAIEVHKDILKHTSPVFEAMLTLDMVENKNNEIHITDMNCRVLNDLIVYCYEKVVPKFNEITKDLVIAADKYFFENLKYKLEEKIIENIDAKNYFEMMCFSEMYRLKKVKTFILHFIKDNISELSK